MSQISDEKVIVIDFGGQYNQLVARRVRECNVYCEIYSYKTDLEQIKAMNPKGIILTGGPNSCYEENSPTYTKELFELGIPVPPQYPAPKCPPNEKALNKPPPHPCAPCINGTTPGKALIVANAPPNIHEYLGLSTGSIFFSFPKQ